MMSGEQEWNQLTIPIPPSTTANSTAGPLATPAYFLAVLSLGGNIHIRCRVGWQPDSLLLQSGDLIIQIKC